MSHRILVLVPQENWKIGRSNLQLLQPENVSARPRKLRDVCRHGVVRAKIAVAVAIECISRWGNEPADEVLSDISCVHGAVIARRGANGGECSQPTLRAESGCDMGGVILLV